MPSKSRKSNPPMKQVATGVRRAQFAARKAEAEARTLLWRQIKERVEFQNSYKGGVPTRTSEGYPMQQGYRMGTMQERFQLSSARDRAIQAVDNNPIAKTLIETESDNVIGDGLNYQPTSDSEAWNREAEDKYWLWKESCSVRGPDMESGCDHNKEVTGHDRLGVIAYEG